MKIEIIAKMPQAFVHECKKCNFSRLTGTTDFRQTQFETFPIEIRQNMDRTLEILSMLDQDYPLGEIKVQVKNPLHLRVGWKLRKLREKDPNMLIDGQIAFRNEIPKYSDLKKYLQSKLTS